MTSVARVERGREERARILRAAFGLMGRPAASVSVQDILDQAGLSTRAFYRHFPSKDALILTMYRESADRINDETRRLVAEADSPVEALSAWIRHQLAVVFDQRRVRRTAVLTSVEARSAAGFDQVHQETAGVRRAQLADVIAAGMRSGHFPLATDPDEDARAVLGAVGALIEARLAGQSTPEWAEAGDHLTGLFLRSFGALGPGRPAEIEK